MPLRAPDFALAVDIGGTKAACALVDSSGRLLSPVEAHPVPFAEDGTADPRRLIELLRPYAQAALAHPGRFHGVGISLCGNVDRDTGLAVLTPNLHWRSVPFGALAREVLGVPVFADTDVRSAGLAEALWGAACGVEHFAWATVGTGYGGYLFLNGKPYGGSHGYAGNFGHTTWDEINGMPCGCGKRGCFETFVAGPAIASQGQRAVESGTAPILTQICAGRTVTTPDVFSAEARGDPGAQAILAEVIRLIAINLGGVVNTLDLEMIVIGGGVVHGCEDFVDRVSARIRSFLMTEEARRDLRIVKESFPNAALIGAAADVFQRHGILKQSHE